MPKLKITIQSKRTGEVTTIIDESGESVIRDNGDLTTGIPFSDTIEDDLQTANLVLRNCQDLDVEPFDIVNVTDVQASKTTCYLVARVFTQTDSAKLDTNEVLLELVEPTKILDTVKIFTLNITNKNLNLYEQIQRLISKAEVRVISSSRFEFFSANSEILSQIKGEDFFFENTTLRNALDEMLSVANRRCKVETISLTGVNNFDEIQITDLSKTAIQDISLNLENQTYEEKNRDISNFGGTIKARGYNSVTKNTVKVIDEYFTTPEANLTTENAVADLHYPIEEMKAFIINDVKATINGKYYNESNPSSAEVYIEFYFGAGKENYLPLNVDIIERLIEQSLYLLLPEQSTAVPEQSQRTYLSWEKGASEISVSPKWKGLLVSTPIFLDVIRLVLLNHLDELKTWIIENEIPAFAGTITPSTDYLNYTLELTGVGDIAFSNSNFLQNSFSAEFIPRVDTAIELSKSDEYDLDVLKMSLMDSQSAKTIDVSRYGKHLINTIEKSGNQEITLDFIHNELTELYPILGKVANTNIYKNYIIFKREYSVFDNMVKAKYYLSKNYNLIQEKIGVSREYRIFNIPPEDNACPIVVRQNILVDIENANNVDSQNMPLYLKKDILTLFGVENDLKEATHFFFSTPEAQEAQGGEAPVLEPYYGEDTVFALPVVKMFTGNAINYLAFPRDNYNVGFSRDGYKIKFWGGGGVQMLYNPYTDTAGECSSFNYCIGSFDYGVVNPNDFPFSYPIIHFGLIDNDEKLRNEVQTITWKKDRTEKPEFNIISQFKSAKDKSIIFNDLSEFFMSNDKTVKIYIDPHKYLQGEVNLSPSASLMEGYEFIYKENSNGDWYLDPNFGWDKIEGSILVVNSVLIVHNGKVLVAINDLITTSSVLTFNYKFDKNL